MKNRFIIIFLATFILTIFAVPHPPQLFAKIIHTKSAVHSKTATTKKKIASTKKVSKANAKKKISSPKVAAVAVPVAAPTSTASYTLTTVGLHHSAASCWTTISGNIYDLTPWIKQHSGSRQPVLSLCGTDSTAAFNTEYAGRAKPTEQLKAFLIGKLQ